MSTVAITLSLYNIYKNKATARVALLSILNLKLKLW
jgi:hypothetical protein